MLIVCLQQACFEGFGGSSLDLDHRIKYMFSGQRLTEIGRCVLSPLK